ncbi:LysM peptidoglycan-binding domain-containing protein [Cryobacterium sp. SO1]|uniref:LysM peptidoglycan-binding domain-containing protein n=1 Tax=Cryobacterium sp. SO1 TaxID=1897061 RepID=UPI001023D5E6|nr:hypothetical protein [Cryobacterium sp. SO1]RZI34292.1 hypothetical protein BJQ95_03433 [Cryobacterium sp. SO1]
MRVNRGGLPSFRSALPGLIVAGLVAFPMVALSSVDSAHAGAPTAVSSALATVERSSTDEDVNYYVVVRKETGEPEFLFEIAERFLGDGNRFTEIFDLNKGRAQPDGKTLTDPTVVDAGWTLQMPSDAAGPGIEFGPLPVVGDVETPAPGEGEAGTEPDQGEEPAADPGDEAGAGIPAAVIIGVIALVAGIVAAVAFAVRARRRAASKGTPFDDSLLRTDTSASWIVDRALRVLMAAAEKAGTAVPRVLGVFFEGPTMRLKLSSPVSPAPEPWTASEDGQSWSASIARLQSEPVSEGSTAAFARLVTLGIAESGRVLVDFALARGPISLEGPTPVTHEVLRRWLGELTGNPWSDEPRVVMIGNGLPEPETVVRMSTFDQLIPELEAESRGILVLSRAPSAAQQALLSERFASSRFGWVVIVLADIPSAKWRFTVDDDNTLRSGFLPDVQFRDRATAIRNAG